MLAYMFMQAGSGRIMDRLGTRLGMMLAIVWWSAASIFHATAGSAAQFAVWRFMLGAGEAGNWPGSVKAISEWFPVKERALATGIFNSGSCIGALVAPPMVVWIAVQWNWRVAFVVTGLLGFVWLILWLLLYRLPENHPRITPRRAGSTSGAAGSVRPMDRRRAPSRAAGGTCSRTGTPWSLVLARMFADPVWWFFVFWLPAYFKSARDFSLEMIGLLVWIPFLTADIGNFVGGGASSYLVKRGVPAVRARKIVMAVSAAVMIASIPAALTRSATTALVLISLATLAYSSWATNVLTLPMDVFRHDAVASATGLGGTGGGLGGMAFTLLTGKIVDLVSYTPIFIMAGIMPLIAATIIVFGIKDRTVGNVPQAEGHRAAS